MPLVSIGLPVFNGENYITDALDSLLGQTFEDFEVIICDNTSTDRTPQICRDYERRDKRVRYYYNQKNDGAAANFNLTFEFAIGKYFKWAAHDDLCGPDFLTRCVEVLERDQEVVIAYPKVMLINEASQELGPYNLKLQTDSPSVITRFHELLRGHKCYEIFGLIRQNVLKKTPLMGNYSHGDGILLSRLALFGRFEEIPEYLFFSRQHPDQFGVMCKRKGGPSSEDCYQQHIWFNPKAGNRMVFPYWRMYLEWFKSIHMAPMSLFDRIRCYRMVYRSARRRRKNLRSDITCQINRLINKIK